MSRRPRSIELVWPDKHRQRPPASGSSTHLAPPVRVAHFGVAHWAATERGLHDPNQLVFGDNLAVLQAWLGRWAGQVDLAYLDPPFATDDDFSITTELGGRKLRSRAYRDGWGRDLGGYLSMLRPRLELVRELLSDRGAVYVHVDYRASALIRCLLDEVFGADACINELIWLYKTGGAARRLGFAKKHDTIWYFAKNPRRALWTPQREKSYLRHEYGFKNVQVHRDEHGPYTWVGCRDVFDIPALRGNQPERVNYPTQKPEALLERILRASSRDGSLVMDPFCGSGTTPAVAERLGRRWLACDESPLAIHTAKKRLLSGNRRAPFELLECARVAADPMRKPGLAVVLEHVAPRAVQVRLAGPGRRSRWGDAIDTWAVDHDFDGEVFRPDWWAVRSAKNRELALIAPVHHYRRGGHHQVMVKASDPFGVEVVRTLPVEPD